MVGVDGDTLEAAPMALRPRSKAILDGAKRVFLAHGFSAASVDAIAREAKVSKATLYEHFRSKEEMFKAMVEGECSRHAQLADRLDAAAGNSDPRTTLCELGRSFLSFLLNPDTIAMYRTMVAEAVRTPELGRAFFAVGPTRLHGHLARYLRHVASGGLIELPDENLAAQHFIGMVRGDLHLRALFSVPEIPSGAALDRHVQLSVDAFLRAYAPVGAAA